MLGGHVVTPCAGVWIEIERLGYPSLKKYVTPCAGVWIEIPPDPAGSPYPCRHSLCGSVD